MIATLVLAITGTFLIGLWLGVFLIQRRVARLGVCFEHLIRHQCSGSKADYIIENARLMFERYGK